MAANGSTTSTIGSGVSPILFGGFTGAGDLLRRNAAVLGHEPGLSFGTTRLTWQAVNARANRLANALQRLGLQRGDRVALYARNSHQWVEALFGLAKIGAVSVTINYRLTAAEVDYIVTNSGARAILCGPTEVENARQVATRVPAVQWLLGVGVSGSDVEDYETLVARGAEHEPVLESPLRFDEPAMLLYTSGTTGFPKGAVYSHGSLLVGLFVHVHAIASRRTHRVMLPSPLYSAAGIAGIYCAVMVGSAITLINFDAVTALETLERERITFTNFVPTTIQMLRARADIGQYDLSALEVLLYGGSPIPAPVLREAMRRLPNCGFRQTFAATETGCSGTVLEPSDHRAALEDPSLAHRLLSCGRPQDGSKSKCLADGELHNHFHWNPYSTPAENADRAAARLMRQKPELNKWLWSHDHNHIDFEHPADSYAVTSEDDRIHSHIHTEFHKHGIAHEHHHVHEPKGKRK